MNKEEVIQLAEDVGGKPGRLIAELATSVVKYVESKEKRRKEKISNLCKPGIMGAQYNDVLLNNFVKIRFSYYGTDETASVKDILRETERERYARNIIITGPAGIGKSTVLKWLYVNADVKGYSSLYVPARFFNQDQFEYNSFKEVLETLDSLIREEKDGEEKCVIFIDGLDELNCLKGKRNEFDDIIDFVNERNRRGKFKFIISTRPEHFAFQKRIKKRDTKKTLDNYLVFQAKPLSRKEAYLVCKSLGKLMMHEKELKGTAHFVGKWPDGQLLSKREYLKLLKTYLNAQDPETSLFSIPLLCRYAYPIICDWNGNMYQASFYSNNNKSHQIQIAIRACTKWEFHDFWEGPTDSGDGLKLFHEYEAKVNSFLTKVAGKMGRQDYISKEEWERLSKKCNLTLNESYCVLQEYDVDKISFAHASFKDYYMAMYYVGVLERHLSRGSIMGSENAEILSRLLWQNSEFSIMYVERLSGSKNPVIRRIINHISCQHDSEWIAKLASGEIWYMFKPDEPFTIKEYLSVFPLGAVHYSNITFNTKVITQLEKTGILEVNDTKLLRDCSCDKICHGLQLHGVIISPAHRDEIKQTSESFYIIDDGALYHVDEYWHRGITWEYIQGILGNKFPQYFDGTMTASDILSIDEVRRELQMQQYNSEVAHLNESLFLIQWIRDTISYIGIEKRYWCLFYSGALYVYEMMPQNEEKINELFSHGIDKSFEEFVSIYGKYCSMLKDLETIVDECRFCDAETLTPAFSANQLVEHKYVFNILCKYYSIHWRNLTILQKGYSYISKQDAEINMLMSANTLLDEYEDVEEWFNNNGNDKLNLIFSDEKLVSLYILGDGERMVNLARSTMSLCEEYDHREGIEFRKFLISDDTSFVGEDYQKVHEFCKKHIWI